MNRPPILTLSNVSKRFAAQEVLSEFNLTIHDGEFFTIFRAVGLR
ncbi:hypothetical protein [Thiothrix subterranea]|nr:hypothetical protein [Thiothrix subterranea]